jgi:hypothetical protein
MMPAGDRARTEVEMRIGKAAALTAMLAAACGGGSTAGTAPDSAAYASQAQAISSAASSYAAAATATTDVPACQSGHAAYDAQVGPMVQRMQSMSGEMDHHMSEMGRTADADMTCGADAMMAELGGHRAMACTFASMTDNHAEASRHAAAMEAWAAHQHARAEEMGGMMGTGGMGMGGAAGTCQRNPDGTFTLVP